MQTTAILYEELTLSENMVFLSALTIINKETFQNFHYQNAKKVFESVSTKAIEMKEWTRRNIISRVGECEVVTQLLDDDGSLSFLELMCTLVSIAFSIKNGSNSFLPLAQYTALSLYLYSIRILPY